MIKYIFLDPFVQLSIRTNETTLDKGKPTVRWGRKTRGLFQKTAQLPKENYNVQCHYASEIADLTKYYFLRRSHVTFWMDFISYSFFFQFTKCRLENLIFR